VARKEARIFTGIWGEPDWRALTAGAQWLYLFLISQPDIAHCGVISLRERRWASNAQEMTPKDIQRHLEELERAGYVVADDVSEEVLIRSFMRHDQVYLQPNLMAAAVAHLPGVESHRVRRAIYSEISRIIRENGDQARAGQKLAPLTEKQKVPIRQMIEVLRRTGDGAQELTAGPRVRPVEVPEDACATKDDLRSNGSHETRSNLVTGLGQSLNDLRSNRVNGGSNEGQTGDPDLGHLTQPPPGGLNPSRNPSPNPLGDRGEVTVVTTDGPFPSPLTPYPSKNNGHDLRSTLLPEPLPIPALDEVQNAPGTEPDDPLLADFGTAPARPWSPHGTEAAFERFWAVYPVKVKKSYARQCWDRAVRQAPPERIIRGAKRYAEDPNRSEEFTAHPSTWLNQGRWDDDPLPARTEARPSTQQAVQRGLDIAAQRRARRTTGGEITDGRR
jgi:hypothetical protein